MNYTTDEVIKIVQEYLYENIEWTSQSMYYKEFFDEWIKEKEMEEVVSYNGIRNVIQSLGNEVKRGNSNIPGDSW